MPQTAANALLAGKLADAPVIGVGHVEHRARGQHDEAHAATEERSGRGPIGVAQRARIARQQAHLAPQATKMAAADFLHRVLVKSPYRIHTVLTDNGIQFGNMRRQPWALLHLFDRVCTEHDIEHRLTQPGHP